MKSDQIRSFFWSVFSRIQSEYGKIRTRKNSVFGHFTQWVGKKVIGEDQVKKKLHCQYKWSILSTSKQFQQVSKQVYAMGKTYTNKFKWFKACSGNLISFQTLKRKYDGLCLNWFKLSSNIFYEKNVGSTSSNIVRKCIQHFLSNCWIQIQMLDDVGSTCWTRFPWPIGPYIAIKSK